MSMEEDGEVLVVGCGVLVEGKAVQRVRQNVVVRMTLFVQCARVG